MNLTQSTSGATATTRTTPMSAQSPRVYDYRDYRKFLSEWLAWKKATQTSYSGTVFAKKAGLASHTLLGMVIRGERNLSYKTIQSFTKAIGLERHEREYFEKLVLFNQATNADEKSYQLSQLVHLGRSQGSSTLERLQDYSDFLSHWWVIALYELVNLHDFSEDPAWIARTLKRKIQPRQAERGLEILQRLGLVERDAKGRLTTAHAAIEIDPGEIDFAIRRFHREFLERTMEAVDGEALKDRELSSLTLSVDKEDLELVKERVREFRRALNLEFSSRSARKEHVVAVNIQALVLTQKEEREEK